MMTNFKYEIKYGLVRITEVESDEETIIVPSKIDGKNVFKICKHSFVGLDCKKIVLPNTIGEVDDDSFVDLDKLKVFECFNIDKINKPFLCCVKKVSVLSHSSKTADILYNNYLFKEVKYDKDFKYEIIDKTLKTCKITGFNIRGKKLIFPNEIDGYKVVEIKGKVSENKLLEKIVFPEYLKVIPKKFLVNKTKINITLPLYLEKIEEDAFFDTSFSNKEIIFPSTLEIIKEGAFYHCSDEFRTKLIFTSDKLIIDKGAFQRRLLYFEDNVNFVLNGKENFWGCVIENINFHSCNKYIPEAAFLSSEIKQLKGFENISFLDKHSFCSTTFPFGILLDLTNIKTLGDNCFQSAKDFGVFIPKDLELKPYTFAFSNIFNVLIDKDYKYTKIPFKCFYMCCGLVKLELPKSIVEIDREAFASSSIETVNLDNIQIIREKAFSDSGLFELSLPNIEMLFEGAFMGCNCLSRASITSDKLRYLPNFTFGMCGHLEEFTIGKNIESILNFCFISTEKLKFIDLKNVKLIGNSCFCNSGLVFANIASCVKLGRSAFDGCQNLKEVIMSFYIKTLPDRVFDDCFSLKKLDISNIEYFKTMCLANTGIKELVFSKDTKEVAEDALYRSKVKKLYFSQDFNTLNQNVLSSLEDLEIICVDIEGVVPPNFLSYKNKLKKVIFTERVEKLGVGAVYFDKSLEMVVLKNENIEISNKNFANCDKLEVLYYDNELEFKSISKRKSNNIKERKDVSKFKDIF